MVNTGRPSRACTGCRAIRSRCDESKPSCKRCTRIGKPCVYPDTDPVFRSMNKWTEQSVKIRVENRLAAREAEETQCMEKYLPSLSALVSLEWESHAIGPFFERFVNQPDSFGSTWGFLPWLPKTYGDRSLPRFLAEATKACALANLANASKIPQLHDLAGQAYGLALKGLHGTMGSPRSATSNETLATMMLLALYELITGTKPAKEMFQAHLYGQAAAMRVRAKQQTLSDMDSSLASHTNRWLLWRDLAERKRPTFGLSNWPQGMYRSWLDELSARFTVNVADLCGRVREMQDFASFYGRLDSDEELVSCIETALDLDKSFEMSYISSPTDWLPVKGSGQTRSALQDKFPPHMVANRECPILNWKIGRQDNVGKQYNLAYADGNEEPYFPRMDTYPSHPIAMQWNLLRVARLHLLRVMIDIHLISKQRPDVEHPALPTIPAIYIKLSETIHDICAVFPYVLGDFYAGTAVGASPRPDLYASGASPSVHAAATLWMLHKVLTVPGISPAIRTWVLGVLERIGTLGNIRQGINMCKLYRQDQPILSAC